MLFRSDRKSTRLNSSHLVISYAVFCLKKKKKERTLRPSTLYRNLSGSLSSLAGEHVAGPICTLPLTMFDLLCYLRLMPGHDSKPAVGRLSANSTAPGGWCVAYGS